MKNRATAIVLTSALGLGGLLTGVVVAPAVAAAATGETTATDAITDRVTRIKDALAGLVSDGSITQAQADEVATTLAESMPDRGPGGHGGPGGPGGGRQLEAAAEVLGTTVDELRTALEGGQSLAQVAEGKGVSEADLVAGLVEAAKAHLAEHVADGSLTQEQADARAADLEARITEMVEREGLPARGDRPGPPPAQDAPADGSSSGATTG